MKTVDDIIAEFNGDSVDEIRRRKLLAELGTISQYATSLKDAAQSETDWEKVFDEVFSDAVSKRVAQIARDLNISFDYYDPDTSYKEDATAFIDALRDYEIFAVTGDELYRH